MFGLDPSDWLLIHRVLIEPLRLRGARVYIFGSRARGDHAPFSDLDVLIESDVRQDELLSVIAEALEESDLPIKVDLVQEKDLANSYSSSAHRDKREVGN